MLTVVVLEVEGVSIMGMGMWCFGWWLRVLMLMLVLVVAVEENRTGGVGIWVCVEVGRCSRAPSRRGILFSFHYHRAGRSPPLFGRFGGFVAVARGAKKR